MINSKDEKIRIRFAVPEDIPLILNFIRALAEYEHMLDMVSATEEVLHQSLFEEKKAEVIICEYEGRPEGFALFFHNYSTFLGKAGIYIEDLFVNPGMRGKGLGKIMLSFLARLAMGKNCGRLEWWCLDWNEPSIRFYKKMGAVPMPDWTVYRITGEKLRELGNV